MAAVPTPTTATTAGVIPVRFDPVPKYDIGPILESMGATLPHHRRTGWQKMRCPLHTDTNPSASVNFLKGSFRCFSCGVFEDGIGLLQQQGLDFKAAREEAARVSGQGDNGVRRQPSRRNTLFGD